MEGFLKPEWLTKGFNDLKGCDTPNQYCYTKWLELTCSYIGLSPGQSWFSCGCHYFGTALVLQLRRGAPIHSVMVFDVVRATANQSPILYLADCAAS